MRVHSRSELSSNSDSAYHSPSIASITSVNQPLHEGSVEMWVQGIHTFLASNYAPIHISLELHCSPMFCLYLYFFFTLLAEYFPKYFCWKDFVHQFISSFRHFTIASFDHWLFPHKCFTHALTMTQVLALPETAVVIQRKICPYILDFDQITCLPLHAERKPLTIFISRGSDVIVVGVLTCEVLQSSLLCCARCNER